MIDPITAGIVAGSAGASAAITYLYAKGGDSDGCNGHHWKEPRPVVGKSTLKDGNAMTRSSREHIHIRKRSRYVSLRVDAKKYCQDCNESKMTTTEVGRVPYSAFVGGE